MVRSTVLLIGVAALSCSTFAFRGAPEGVPARSERVACALVAARADHGAECAPAAKVPAVVGISEAGLRLIKEFEGFAARPHWDHAQWSIGYGARSEPARGSITEPEADETLRRDTTALSQRILAASRVPLSQAQLDALTSFAYNVGAAALLGYGPRQPSTLWRRVQAGDMAGAAREFCRWNRAGGRELRGLTRRREREADLFARGAAE